MNEAPEPITVSYCNPKMVTLPENWLVTELGFWVGPHFDGFAGFRVRPGPRTSPRLWLGAAYGSYCHRQPLGRQRRAVGGPIDAVCSVACFELLMLTLADASASKRNQDVGNQAPNAGGGRA